MCTYEYCIRPATYKMEDRLFANLAAIIGLTPNKAQSGVPLVVLGPWPLSARLLYLRDMINARQHDSRYKEY